MMGSRLSGRRALRSVALGASVGLAALFLAVLLWGMRGATSIHALNDIYFVNGVTGDDTGNSCVSSTSPCRTIGGAMARAGAGDTIKVTSGVYTDPIGTVAVITKSVTLLGGWDSAFSSQDPDQYPTVLDARRMGTVISISSPITTTPITPHIEGFIVTGGDGSHNSQCAFDLSGCGGGIRSYYADPAIVGNVITDNIGSTGSGAFGGGIDLEHASAAALISGNLVISNIASTGGGGVGCGGGIAVYYGAPRIMDNDVLSNTSSSGDLGYAGGLYIIDSSATLQENRVRWNIASTAADGYGGGISVGRSDAAVISNTIEHNVASTVAWGDGGGLRIVSAPGAKAIGNTIAHNTATLESGSGFGGGFYAIWTESFTFTNNTVSNNRAYDNGGGLFIQGSSFHMAGNDIISNTAGAGGGIYIFGEVCTGTLQSNHILSNTAASADGGGINISITATLTFSDNVIANNVASVSGAGMYIGGGGASDVRVYDTVVRDNRALGDAAGGIWASNGAYLELVNAIVAGNEASECCPGIFVYHASARVMNTTIARNVYPHDDGAAFTVDFGDEAGLFASVTNSILWGNEPADWIQYGEGLSPLTVTYSILGKGFLPGPGNNSADPGFVDPDQGDYRLLAWSPAIDAGTADGAPDHDFEGDARPQNAAYDMGADEFVGTPAANQGTRYVATSGTDAGPNLCLDGGAPCQTIGHALDKASVGEMILVAGGVYTENLGISKPVMLSGGYEAGGWTQDVALYETVLDGSNSSNVEGDWDGSWLNAPAVISDGGVLKMWYTGRDPFGTTGIGYAESADGVNWVRQAAPVLIEGDPGDWDEQEIGQPAVIKQDGVYKMWYLGTRADGIKQIGYATSDDGVSWTKYAGSPVLTVGAQGAWDETEVCSPAVLFDGASYHLWYHGYSGDMRDSIGYATSPDGINWTKHPANPILGLGPSGGWDDGFIYATDVLTDNGQLHMWYTGVNTGWTARAIGYVTSTDGVAWTRSLTGPVLQSGAPGTWDDAYVIEPTVIKSGGLWHMWYRGRGSAGVALGYATSSDGVNWTKHAGNPVFQTGAAWQWGAGVVVFSAGSDGAVLEGFTLRNGEAWRGGGLSVDGAEVTVQDCVVEGNSAGQGGGGIYVGNGSHATIRDTEVFSNSTFGEPGGGIFVAGQGTHAEVYDSVVAYNEAGDVAGVWISDGANTILDGNRIVSNTITTDGYGSSGVSIDGYSAATLTSNEIAWNKAISATSGCAVGVAEWATAILDANTIANNSFVGGGDGLAVRNGAAVTATNNLIVQNQSSDGAGIGAGWGDAVDIRIINNTIAGHTAQGILLDSGTALIRNNILYGNGGGIDNVDSGATVTCDHNAFWDNGWNYSNVAPGIGDIDADPQFVAAASGDYHLRESSPCVDAGTVESAPDHDFEGDTRPRDAGYDIGADEYVGPCATPLAGVTLLGPTKGYTNTAYAFIAFITPTDATPPITYTWTPAPVAGQGTNVATYTWDTPDTYAIAVSVANCGATMNDIRSVEISALSPPTKGDDYEDDDACDTASTILTNGASQIHTFHDQGDVDWAAFTATLGVTYFIEVRVPPTSTADVELELYDTCGGDEDVHDPTFSPDIRLVFRAPTDGRYVLRLSNDNPAIYGAQATYHLSVREIRPSSVSGALVIVAGRLDEDNELQANIHYVTNATYQLARDNGCGPEQIYYLATDPTLDADGDEVPDVVTRTNRANLKYAITDWAASRVGPDQPFTLYLMDHGGYDEFYLDGTVGEVITPTALSGWLDTLDPTGAEVNVIVEACHSGSFIDLAGTVSDEGRMVMASTGPFGLAYATQMGALFSDALLNALGQGLSLKTAFEEGQWAVRQAHPDQTPWLDGDGDGRANESEDMQLATARVFACAAAGPEAEQWPPHIVQVDVTGLEGHTGEIWAQVKDDLGVQSVWAVVYPPSYQPPPGEVFEAEPPPVTLQSRGEGWYSGRYVEFKEGGEYRVIVYARDKDGLDARPKEHKIEKRLRVYLPVLLRNKY